MDVDEDSYHSSEDEHSLLLTSMSRPKLNDVVTPILSPMGEGIDGIEVDLKVLESLGCERIAILKEDDENEEDVEENEADK